MNNEQLADLLFPDVEYDTAHYEQAYPERNLPPHAEVLRIAPSPTGFIHLGNLYGALADERIAHQSNGVFYLRIEDTDNKRLVKGAVATIISTFKYFQIPFDEGAEVENHNGNAYGPYYQRQRVAIYHAYVKELIRKGLAYPCFCTEAELKSQREQQQQLKLATGYYGEWAVCRHLDLPAIKAKLAAQAPYVIRLRSHGNSERKHTFHDEIKGDITVPENDQDIVLLKADGVPTYHFAHAIDDHLMHTTIVLRGEEWLGTLPVHLELFKDLGFVLPRYAHTSQLMKMDNGVKRKLSKRKDPELSLDYYRRLGYHPYAVKLYLMTLLNWNFEQWYLKYPDRNLADFKFTLSNMGQSGALFDLDKLNNISKTYLAKMNVSEMYDFLYDYVSSVIPEHKRIYFSDKKYLEDILYLGMGCDLKKRRKDYIYAQQILKLIDYYFDDTFAPEYEFSLDKDSCAKIIQAFVSEYNYDDDNEVWFAKLKHIAERYGFACDMREYRQNPEAYPGSISDVAEIIRVAATGMKNTPDLWSIMQIMGKNRIIDRLDQALIYLKASR